MLWEGQGPALWATYGSNPSKRIQEQSAISLTKSENMKLSSPIKHYNERDSNGYKMSCCEQIFTIHLKLHSMSMYLLLQLSITATHLMGKKDLKTSLSKHVLCCHFENLHS